MKPEFIDLIENARKGKREKLKNQVFIFAICLSLSFFLWSLVRLSQNYYYTVEYRLSFNQLPGNLRITAASDTTLTVKIKIQGYELFSERFLKSKEDRLLEVSLRNIRLRGNETTPRGFLLTQRLGKEIASQENFPGDLFIVTPDTLFFEFERQQIRRVPSRYGNTQVKHHTSDTVRNQPDSLQKVDRDRIYLKYNK